MANILVTGASGLVGAEICNYLRSKGHDVIGTVRKPEQADEKNICIDLSEPNLKLDNYFKNIDAVVHTAAVVPNRKSIANDEKNKQKTIAIDRNVADFCIKNKLPTIYFSSCNLYKSNKNDIKNEQSQTIAPTLHHEAKLIGESIFAKNENTTIARINSPYGINLSNEAVLKIFLLKAYNNETITIWGTGKREQDFIHVRDIAKFVNLALFSNQTGVFNVASGQTTSMKELAKLCIKICGQGKIEYNNEAELTDYYPRFSIQKAKYLLNWQPTIGLEQGLSLIVESLNNDKK